MLQINRSIMLVLLIVCSFVQSQDSSSGPVPTNFEYKVKNGSDICLFGQFNAQITIPYFDKDGTPKSEVFVINGTNQWVGTDRSRCDENTGLVSLQWPNYQKWALELYFQKTESNLYSLVNVTLNYTLQKQMFPSCNETDTSYLVRNTQSQFSCSIGSYYSCTSKQTIKLMVVKDAYPEVSLSFTDFKAEAFRSSPDEKFVGYATTCNADYVPDKAVPIAVGVTLAILIVVALLTFILGSRFRQNGYAQI